MRKITTLLALSWATQFAAPAATNEWAPRAEIRSPEANIRFASRWQPDGLRLRLEDGESAAYALIDIAGDSSRATVVSGAPVKPIRVESASFTPAALPRPSPQPAAVLVKIRAEAWSVYLDGRLAALLPPLFVQPSALLERPAEIPAGDEAKAAVQKIADIYFHDDFLVDTNETLILQAWTTEAGTWGLHTALEEALQSGVNQERITQRPLRADFSPNFYSLNGAGTNAIITTGYAFYDRYDVSAAVQVKPGESGLVFLYADATNYVAFTMRVPDDNSPSLLSAWRRVPGGAEATQRLPLGAVEADLIPGQWVQLRARLFENRLQTFVDNTLVLDVTADLPPGGKAGLFRHGPERAVFDDVVIRSNRDLDLRTPALVRFHSTAGEGDFLARPWSIFGAADDGALGPPPSSRPQWLALGPAGHAGHVFSATFTPRDSGGGFGLLTGVTDASKPYYRFARTAAHGRESFTLERVTPAGAAPLEAVTLTAPSASLRPGPVTLMADATDDSALRLYRDGKLVLVHHPAAPVTGGSGLYVAPRVNVRISNLVYQAARDNIYKSRFEKNQVYIADPFMRHWSSPEGDWIGDERDLVWHKSDFFGRLEMSLPFSAPAQVHLGVEDGQLNGDLVLSLSSNTLALFAGDRWPEPPAVVRQAPGAAPTEPEVRRHDGRPRWPRQLKGAVPPAGGVNSVMRRMPPEADSQPAAPATNAAGQTAVPPPPPEPGIGEALASAPVPLSLSTGMPVQLSYEGHWLWIASGTNVLLRYALPAPLEGTRLRLAGALTNQLGQCLVVRYGVRDHLFTEAPSDWTINGGQWEIINRFNCDPRWSHMNGEGTNGLAAIWTKYRFGGDFCLELYTGMRHGWYDRCGDFNVSIMAPNTSASGGYTATATGWDYDHSQLYSRLYRKGEVVAESEEQLAPRIREGNRRARVESIIRAGRDVHGAWYYIKFRRIGNRLEYWFDNELIHAWTDPAPLDEGMAGVWTYLNSIMVARVKIAASRISPIPFAFTPVQPRNWAAASVAPDAAGPLFMPMASTNWAVDDAVGHARLTWQPAGDGSPDSFTLRNRLGGGTLFTESRLPPVPFGEVAGWRFLVKRTPRAQLNFHYSVGRLVEGRYVPLRRFFHRLSGPDFGLGEFRMSGSSDVPPSPADPDRWSRADWTVVEAWLPIYGMEAYASDPSILARAEGFGILQPSYEQQGLTGNGPGEAYAVADFSEIRCAVPTLATTGTTVDAAAILADPQSGRTLARCATLAEAQRWLDGRTAPGLHAVRVAVSNQQAVESRVLSWITLPPMPDVTCDWSRSEPNSLEVRTRTSIPDRRFAAASLLAGPHAVPLQNRDLTLRVGALPPAVDWAPLRTNAWLDLSLTVAGTNLAFRVRWDGARRPEPPLLVALEGTPLCESFESRTFGRYLNPEGERMALLSDPVQGQYLRVSNRGMGERLRATFNAGYSLARYPLLAFRYRGTAMSRLSIGLPSSSFVGFSENHGPALRAAYSSNAIMDGTWRTWCGRISDAVAPGSLDVRMFWMPVLAFGSYAAADQTGRFSSWDIDDLVAGPAVSKADQLAITPRYASPDGVKSVSYAVRPGTPGAAPGVAPPAWTEVEPGKKIAPSLEGLAEGPYVISFKAAGPTGAESTVTEMPFVIDRTPPTVSFGLDRTGDPLCNATVLRIAATEADGLPLALEDLQLRWNDKPGTWNDLFNRFSRNGGTETLFLNWTYVFRQQINECANGARAEIVVANIHDGAGNAVPDIRVPIEIDYQKDKLGPTLLPVAYPTGSVFTAVSYEGRRQPPALLAADADCTVSVIHRGTSEPYAHSEVKTKQGRLTFPFADRPWPLESYPYLSFVIRQPAMRTNETTRIELVLDLSTGIRTIALTQPPAKGALALSTPIPWQSNQWHAVTLNMPALLQQAVKADELKKAVVKSVAFVRTDSWERQALDIQTLLVHSRWRPGDVVKFDGFDASGMAGITAGSAALATMDLAPAAPPAGSIENGWMAVRLRDKAGNMSWPVRVPVP